MSRTRSEKEARSLQQAWGIPLMAAERVRENQKQAAVPSVSDVLPKLTEHFDLELRHYASLSPGVELTLGGARRRVGEARATRSVTSTPIFLDPATAAVTGVCGGPNSGKTTLMHTLVEQAVAFNGPSVQVTVVGAEKDPLISRVQHLGDDVELVQTIGEAIESRQAATRIIVIDDLDSVLARDRDNWRQWDLLRAGLEGQHVIASFAAATRRSVPLEFIQPVTAPVSRVLLNGAKLPGAAEVVLPPWVAVVDGPQGERRVIPFGDLPAGTSPNGADAPITAAVLANYFGVEVEQVDGDDFRCELAEVLDPVDGTLDPIRVSGELVPAVEGADRGTVAEPVPDMLEALSIVDVDTHDFVETWKINDAREGLEIPWGTLRSGDTKLPELSVLSLGEPGRGGDGVHGVFAGETGSGVSFALRTLVECGCATYSPSRLSWVLVDFEAGGTFAGLQDLPHVVTVNNLARQRDLVDRLVYSMLGQIDRRKETIVEQHQCNDLEAYRRAQRAHAGSPDWPEIPDLVLVVHGLDHVAANDDPLFFEALQRVGDAGRAYGIHIILSGQRISGPSTIGAAQSLVQFNYSTRADGVTSRFMFGSGVATVIPRDGLKGKMVRQHAGETLPVECVAFDNDKPYQDEGDARISQGAALVRKLSDYTQLRALKLWEPPLQEPHSIADITPVPAATEGADGPSIRIGDLDLPVKGVRLPWTIDFTGSDCHYLVAGAAKSGRTTLLQTLVLMGGIQASPDLLSFMIIDRGTGGLSVLKDSPNVSAYAGPTDEATAQRMFGEAAKIIATRQQAMAGLGYHRIGDYLAAKADDPELMAADPYGYIILCLDSLGGYLGNKEDRKPRSAPLAEILDRGGDRGIFLVFTADNASVGVSGNVMPFELSGKVTRDIQLYNSSYSVINGGSPFKSALEARIPSGQPGRSVVPVDDDFVEARVLVPVLEKIEPDSIREGAKVYPLRTYPVEKTVDYLRELRPGVSAHQLEPVPTDVPFDRIYDVYAQHWPLDPHRNLAHTKHPIGVQVSTGALELLPGNNQHLIVYGRPKSGRTTTLRVMMESVMRQYTPQQARIVVIDPRRLMAAEARDAQNRGYVADAKQALRDGGPVLVRTSGYVTDFDQIPVTVAMLGKVMQSNLPPEDVEPDDIEARSFVKGPEIFVFVDNFDALTGETAMARSVFDDLGPLLRSYGDLGVHFIVATSQDLKDQLATSVFLKNLRHLAQAPVMQLAGRARSGHLDSDYSAVPREDWPAGRGRLITSSASWQMVQIANQPRPQQSAVREAGLDGAQLAAGTPEGPQEQELNESA